MSADQILDALDPDQRAVATALTGPVCVLAGAGTGKTRAITHRIAYGVRTGTYPPTSVLAVTFTARAAGEMRTRLRTLGVGGVQARTFHAAALRQLGYFWPTVVGGPVPRLVDHKARLVAEAATRLGLTVDRLSVRDLASEIEWSKVSLVAADDYVAAAVGAGRPAPAGFDHAAVARLVTAYEETKTDRNLIDFEDVLLVLCGILQERPEIADQVRRQYRHFVVDEYQDVSPLQQHLLDLWLGDRHELCVVGDPSQTIYSFAGATPHHLLSFTQAHPGAQVVRLVRDYRSTPQVVDLANRTLRAAGREQAGGLELIAQRPAGPPVGFTVYDDDEAEAAGVAGRAARLIAAGVPAREIAVLYRTNAQSEAFEQAFADAGVGYLVRGGERFFQRKEVRDALVLLRGSARSMTGVPAGEAARDVLAAAGWTAEPPPSRGAVRERWDSLQALVALADDLPSGAGLVEMVAELDERASAQHAPSVDGVTLASLHAAKGLEWDAVFLVGLSDGLMPISLAETPEAVAEERRLLYVGVTRARERLELSWARSRAPGSRASRRRTPFLDRIWPDGGRPGRVTARAGGRRAELDGEPDPGLLAVLEEWRSAEAQAVSRPPWTVLSDVALRSLAARAPRDVRGLAQVQGVGPRTIDRHGEALLRLIRQGADERR